MQVPPPVKFAWLVLGIQRRSQQLLHTGQDNTLIFVDVEEQGFGYSRTLQKILAIDNVARKERALHAGRSGRQVQYLQSGQAYSNW